MLNLSVHDWLLVYSVPEHNRAKATTVWFGPAENL